jgi:hypothetical protein
MGAAGPLRRVLNEANLPGLLETLSERLPGADLTTLLLEVTRRRAANVSPATLMSRYDEDRFVAPGGVSFERLRRAEDSLLDALPAHYEAVTLAPVVPLGTHSALGTVDQNKIVSTVRGSEVAADPTNGLALEAARRRRAIKRHHPHSAERVNLASIQRVLRAQRMEGTATFSHFCLFGLVTAGRDTGHLAFERAAAAGHIRFIADALTLAGATRVRVELTDFSGDNAVVWDDARAALVDRTDVDVVDLPDRAEGRGYYDGLCFAPTPRSAIRRWRSPTEGPSIGRGSCWRTPRSGSSSAA